MPGQRRSLATPAAGRHRPWLRAARVLGCLVAARYAGLPAVREYREALLTG
jgi:hypothetical protein